MRLSKATVYRLMRDHEIQAVRFGRTYRISEAAVADYTLVRFSGTAMDVKFKICLDGQGWIAQQTNSRFTSQIRVRSSLQCTTAADAGVLARIS
ncbi:excisionase family DNA-binding protein [Arthrobacter sp. ISL-85]|nr:excisionase family DNA-binding protein [Arthrobacter sp. ISL-85]